MELTLASILVVDDEAGMRELLKRYLLAQQRMVLEARTAEAALDLMALAPDIHVVVADLEMPGHGGAWLVEQLQQRFPDVAVILSTADDAVPGTLSLQPSIVKYLVKPVRSEDLLDAVEAGLALHERLAKASSAKRAGADPIESWIDQKLTRGEPQ